MTRSRFTRRRRRNCDAALSLLGPRVVTAFKYHVVLYSHRDSRTVEVYLLKEDVLKKAIQREEISGNVIKGSQDSELLFETSDDILIQADTQELRAWLEKVGTLAFDMKEPLSLRAVP